MSGGIGLGMSIPEEKWNVHQPEQSPKHPHSQMNTMSNENNFMPTYPYETTSSQQMHQQQMPVHEGNHMYLPPKQEMDAAPRQSQFQGGFVSMSAPNTPNASRQTNGSPGAQSTPGAQSQDRKSMEVPSFLKRSNIIMFTVWTGLQGIYFSLPQKRVYKLTIKSKVDRGFFLADNDWTCYRRNYFQISSAFTITTSSGHTVNESETPCLVEVDSQFHTCTQFLLGITARVSNSDKKIELVQHTPKRDKGPQSVPTPKPIRPGGNLSLSSVGSNSNIVTFERIQFKTATANNGKRRAAQQYYVVLVDLYAQPESGGELIRIATSTSAPLVVRGRSPGHYADNHHDRYSPMAINPAFSNDRHLSFPHPQGPNGAPGVMSGDFGGSPFPPYGQYPPFSGFPPVNPPMRNDALSLIMTTSPQNPPNPSFHPQHPHQPYMVPSISEVSQPESNAPDMYNNPNIDPNSLVNGHDQKIPPHHGHHSQQVGLDLHNIEVAGTSSPHSAFTSFESRQVQTTDTEGYHPMYHNHPANNAPPPPPPHHPGYHPDNQNGYQANGRVSPPQQARRDTSTSTGSEHTSASPHADSKLVTANANNNNACSSPQSSNSSTTTPTSEIGKGIGQMRT
ncbi:9528_t:CDS:2 [Paraglomus occultum]|uniref:9528_t:CDS:1 n=1 Tax=Paraglomus occultum TaxID=144539 RepID=A0A9N8WAQ8_9GLOM|nr:9528_t:CDS:2 [Paraglomus occultum]